MHAAIFVGYRVRISVELAVAFGRQSEGHEGCAK